MDITTIFGLIAVILVMAKAVAGDPVGFYDGLSLLIVLVGGIAATLVAYRLQDVIAIFGILKNAFVARSTPPAELVEKNVAFAETARREGILALEQAVKEVKDPFMATGIRLAVDGTEPELVQTILETELSFLEERHNQGQRLLKTLGIHWAIFGGIGALVVLASTPGGGESGLALVSRSAVPALYGLLLAGLSAISFRRKLEARSGEEVLTKRMIMEGIMSIQSGDNPRIVEQKLNVFIAPNLRAAGKPKANRSETEEKPSPEALDELAQPDPELQKQAGEIVQRLQAAMQDREVLPGPPSVKDLLPLVQEEVRNEILEAMGEGIPVPPEQIRSFDFEDIARLTDREIQMILRETETKVLVLALKGASRELMGRFMANVSKRVGIMIKEDMARRKSVRLREVVDAHLRIIHTVLVLATRGQVTVKRGGGEG